MKSEEIKKLVAKSENAAVEFKRARGGVPTDFWPSYSAFANTDGGTIILGIREKDGKREVEGLPDVEKKAISEDVNAEVKMKKTVSEDVNRISDDEKQGSEGEKGEFDILMGAYRNDFRENARKVLAAFAEDPEVDIPSVAKRLGFSSISVWRAIRAMKEVGLLVREGGDKGGKWIVKK